MEELRQYLCLEMQELQLDSEIYLEHVLGLLYCAADQNGDTNSLIHFFQECNLTYEDSESVASRMYESYLTAWWSVSQEQLDSEVTVSLDSAVDASFAETGIGPPPGLIPNELVDEYDYQYAQTDTEAYANGSFDLMVMVDQVEDGLRKQHKFTQEFPPEVLFLALNKAHCDITLTIRLLMHNVDILAACKPCRHLLQSRCVRSDCLFDHELHCIPCKYWLYYGSCKLAEECLFIHDLVEPTDMTSSSLADTNGSSLPSTVVEATVWPSLSSNSTNTTTTIATNTSSSKKLPIHKKQKSAIIGKNQSSITKETGLETAVDAFPSLQTSVATLQSTSKKQQKQHQRLLQHQQQEIEASNSYIDAISRAPVSSSSTVSSHNTTHTVYPNTTSFGEFTSLKDALLAGGFLSSTNTNYNTKSAHNSHKTSNVTGGWMEGGQSLRNTYETLRQDAATFARARNQYLQQATQAYLAGDRRSARNYSAKGQELNVNMKKAHKEAALCLFQQRNHNLQQLCEQGILDLHGLHVAEAEELLSELLPIFLHHYSKSSVAGGKKSTIRIVTGSGHHSVTYGHGTARLLPAIQSLVSDLLDSSPSVLGQRWKMQDVKDTNGYVSGVLLTI